MIEATAHRDELRRQFRHVFVDEYQDTDPARSTCSARWPETVATWWSSATRTSRSTGSGGPRCAGSWSSPPSSRAPTARPRRSCRCVRHAGSARACWSRPSGSPAASGCPAAIDAGARAAFLSPVADARLTPAWSRCAPTTPSAPRRSTSPTCSAGPTSRTACRGTGWPCWSAPGAPTSRRCAGPSVAAGVPVEVARDELPLVQDPSVLPLLDALRAAVNVDNDDGDSADHVGPARAESLLLGPLGGLDAGDVRRLSRLLRLREKESARDDGRLPLTSKELAETCRAGRRLPGRPRRPRGHRRPRARTR